jgi:hypothetical protein
MVCAESFLEFCCEDLVRKWEGDGEDGAEDKRSAEDYALSFHTRLGQSQTGIYMPRGVTIPGKLRCGSLITGGPWDGTSILSPNRQIGR